MARPLVVILDDWHDACAHQPSLERLAARAEVRRYTDPAPTFEERVRRLAGAVAVVAMRERTPFDAALFAAAPALRLLVQTGSGLHHVDQAAAAAHGVRIVTTGGPDYPVAELTICLLIGLLRRIPWADRQLRAGGWPVYVGEDCYGKTLGVLGFGRIGSQVARLAQVLGMRVVAWGPTLSRERLQLLKPGAYLINTARGALVDEAALVELLRAGRLAGAALDVYQQEPLPADHPLRQLDNVVLTPHVGWPSAGNFRYWCERAVEHLVAFLDEVARTP